MRLLRGIFGLFCPSNSDSNWIILLQSGNLAPKIQSIFLIFRVLLNALFSHLCPDARDLAHGRRLQGHREDVLRHPHGHPQRAHLPQHRRHARLQRVVDLPARRVVVALRVALRDLVLDGVAVE